MQLPEMIRFDVDALADPDAFHWPGYFWLWNDVLEREALFRQLRDMDSVGAKNIWILPVPADFRPNSMKTNLQPEYLSEEYLAILDDLVVEMQRRGMKLWLYDEGGWPSGGNCGRIVRERPEWARQTLVRRDVAAGELERVPGDCIAAFQAAGNGGGRRLGPGNQLDAAHGAEVYFAQLGHETALVPSYPDLLNPEVTKTFIAGSHEAYRRVLGRHFGDTIPLILSDEPRVDNPPWTGDLAAAFRAEKGYDIRDVLPAVFQEDEATAQVRIDYFDWWSRRFAEAFFGQIQQWSARNGLWSIGHLGGEDLTIGSRKYGFGHAMRVLRKYDIPGVDTIWKQLHPGRKAVLTVHWDTSEGSLPVADNHHFPKYASSVAHQSGTPWSWTESFSAYGSALTLEEMKWITDSQFVRGINLLISGQTLLSTKGHYMGFIRPMFVRENPLFRHLDLFQAYTARLSYLLSLGRPAIRAALYFPVRDIWAGGAELDRIAASNDALAHTLLAHQCDFDMIDDDLLEEAATSAHDGCLHAGPMRYDTVYVSRTRHMSDGSREKLARFIGAGGRVYWVDNRNASEAPAGSTSIELDDLDRRHVEPLVDVRPANAGVRVCRRDLENGALYFLTNEGSGVGKEDAAATDVTIVFKDARSMVRIDPETGTCSRPEDAEHTDGTCSVPLSMRFAESYVFLFTDDDVPVARTPAQSCRDRLPLDEGWTCRRTRAFRIGDEEFELADVHEEAFPIMLGDWGDALGHDFAGDAEYRVDFQLSRPEAARASTLDLGQVWGVAAVVLNGVPLGRRAWEPFRLDLNGAASAGANTLRVTVTNTMANQFLHTRKLDRWPDNVLGIYHKQCLALEKGCTKSGLIGPVTISLA